MNVFSHLKNDIIDAGLSLGYTIEDLNNLSIENPKDPLHGDIATNIAMTLASKTKANPKIIAEKFKEALHSIDYIADIAIAGPGFLNFTIKHHLWHETLAAILLQDPKLYQLDIGLGLKTNIEYLSANPTGPVHIGHARGAVYGDILARLLKQCGYAVCEEYFINDAGSQINTLVDSLMLRYREVKTKMPVNIPEGLYPGEYLIHTAKKLFDLHHEKFEALDKDAQKNFARSFVLVEMMSLIKNDLARLKIKHEVFFSEHSLHQEGKIDQAIAQLENKGLIYYGILPPPKGKVPTKWEEKEQLLFRSTNFGDSQDRPLKKSDGSWSYFAADIAYLNDKINREFKKLVIVLGADHGGYVDRIKAACHALSDGMVEIDIKICQLVNYLEEGQAVKMSKRSGKLNTLQDILETVDNDIIRFMLLCRKNDQVIDFDLNQVVKQSKDNPVFYVQYCYVRTNSILNNAKESFPEAYELFLKNEFNLSLLSLEEEINLIKLLAFYPKMLELAAVHSEPHRIAIYIQNVTAKFHALWNFIQEDNNYRFIVHDDLKLTAARLALVQAVQNVLKWAFKIMGVTLLEKM